MRPTLLLLLFAGCADLDQETESIASASRLPCDFPFGTLPSAGAARSGTVPPSCTSGFLPPPDDGPIGAGNTDDRPDRGHEVFRPSLACVGLGGTGLPFCPNHNSLVVHIPGHDAQPSNHLPFLEAAWLLGFHVIGLDYPSHVAFASVCNGLSQDDELDCIEGLREEVVFARDKTDYPLETHRQDAIMKRLKALLLYLFIWDPLGGWGDFIVFDSSEPDGFRPRFSRIVFTGHSLGSGYAAYVAKEKQVRRVVLLAGPIDGITGNPPISAPWLFQHATPSSSYFGLMHVDDNLENPERTELKFANWTALGMTPQNPVDVRLHPGTTAHKLKSTEPCTPPSCGPHTTVAKDSDTYFHIWRMMLGPP